MSGEAEPGGSAQPPGAARFLRDVQALYRLADVPRWRLTVLVGFGLLLSLAEGAGLGVALVLIYRLFDPGRAPSGESAGDLYTGVLHLLPAPMAGVVGLAVATVALFGCKSLLGGVYAGMTEIISLNTAHRVRTALYRLFLQPDGGGPPPDAGLMLNALEWEVTFVPGLVLGLAALLQNLCALGVYVGLLALLSWRVTLVSVGLGIAVAAVSGAASLVLSKLSPPVLAAAQNLARIHMAGIQGLRAIRLFSAQGPFQQLQFDRSLSLRTSSGRPALAGATLGPFVQMAKLVAFAVLLSAAYLMHLGAALTIALVALFYRLAPHLSGLEQGTGQMMRDRAMYRNIVAILEAPRAQVTPGSMTFDGRFSQITFERVSHAYRDDGRLSLSKVDLRLKRGSWTAIVGESGGGKTTVVNMLGRLLRPDEGMITIDGQPLEHYDLESWLSRVAFSGQDVELIDGSVLDNVVMGRKHVDITAVEEALEIAGAGFAADLPLGLQTQVGDRGDRLSGGQRQRIALARALAGRPDILVLDEATNALEPEMEAAIRARLLQRQPKLTLITVTHRGDLTGADQVVVLRNGRTECIALDAA